ncbi:helix-turn-helix domain-containing protein [Erysipelothrix sp. D19-032]
MSDNTKEIFSENLKKYMGIHKLNQEEIAEITGVSQSSVSAWLAGKTIPRMGVIEKLSIKFGIMKSDLLERKNHSAIAGIKIPVLGTVPAGIPIEAIEDIVDYEEIPQAMAYGGEFYGLKIKGDSMSPRILNDDVVIVEKQSHIDSGDIAIVMVNGFDATCKKVLIKENGIMLQPLNPEFETVFYTPEQIEALPVSIIGKVVELRGKFK